MRFWSIRNLVASIPYMALLLGGYLFAHGTFGTFENAANKEFVSGLGKTILASGIFALLLKTVQFLGVFKEELSKVVYDQKFLANRKDLMEVWENTSKIIFKNKFPKISKRLLKDITENYFPSQNFYYEDLEHFITITFADQNVVEVSYTVNLEIISSAQNEKCVFEFMSAVSFKESEEEIEIPIRTLKIDGVLSFPETTKSITNNTLITKHTIALQGKDSYKIERHEIRRYRLDFDNILYFRAIVLTNNLTVTLDHPDNLSVDFRKCGTIMDFTQHRNTQHVKQFRYNGVIYPQQGYIITLNKKNHE